MNIFKNDLVTISGHIDIEEFNKMTNLCYFRVDIERISAFQNEKISMTVIAYRTAKKNTVELDKYILHNETNNKFQLQLIHMNINE